jgi:hypothetical protein
LLGEEGVAEVGRPLDVVGQPLDHVREHGHRLDARVPVHLLHCVRQRLALQIRVLREPLLELDELEWVGRRGKDLRKKRVWIERNRRDERVELFVRNSRSLLGRAHRWLLGQSRARGDGDQQERAHHGSQSMLIANACEHGARG